MSVGLESLSGYVSLEPAPLEELEDLLERIPAAKERNFLGSALESAYSSVQKNERLADRLAEFAAYFPICAAYLYHPEEAKLILSRTKHIGAQLAGASSSEDYAEARHHMASLEREVTALERAVTQALQRLVQVEFFNTGALGEVLAHVDETRELGSRMLKLGREAQGLVDIDGEQIATEVSRLRELRQFLRDELAGLGADEAVVSFLQDIARGEEISLSKIQGTVLPWLEEHGAMNLFVVSLKV